MICKEQIEQSLAPLLNEPLSDMWRYAGLQRFEFGIQRPSRNSKGEVITIADYALIVTCNWTITGPDGTIVSASDYRGAERHDAQAHWFFRMLKEHGPLVKKIEAEDNGNVTFRLGEGMSLFVFASEDYVGELWRFIPKDKRRRDFVITRDE